MAELENNPTHHMPAVADSDRLPYIRGAGSIPASGSKGRQVLWVND